MTLRFLDVSSAPLSVAPLVLVLLGCSPVGSDKPFDPKANPCCEPTPASDPNALAPQPNMLADDEAPDSAPPEEPLPPAFDGPGPITGQWAPNSSVESGLSGLRVFTDHIQDEQRISPSLKGNLVDGDHDTVFAMYRVQDYDFRVDLAQPAVVKSIELVQPWSNWSKPTALRVSNAAGESVELTSIQASREPITYRLPFELPTDFLLIEIIGASIGSIGAGLDQHFGGLAELRLTGLLVDSGGAHGAPTIGNVRVDRLSETTTRVQWTTATPATSQLFFRDRTGRFYVPGDGMLRNQHEVLVESSALVTGLLKLRSVTGEGLSEDYWDSTLAGGGRIDGRDFLFGVGADHQEASTSHGSSSSIRADGLRNDYVNTWLSTQNGWRDWLPSWLEEAASAGYQPQVLHWFYGDVPMQADVLATRDAYRASIIEMDRMLQESGLGNEAVVTLEPEYNAPEGDLAAWDGWNDIMIDAINIIKAGSGAQVCLYAGWWDHQNFVTTSLGRAALHADCVSTQKMAASTDSTVAADLRETKARNAVSDAIRFSHFMRRKFMLPVRWDYFMVSNYGGWEGVQSDVMNELCNRLPEVRQSGVMGIAWMAYQDSQDQHNLIYGEAEYHKGLIDGSGNKKPFAWDIWNGCGGL